MGETDIFAQVADSISLKSGKGLPNGSGYKTKIVVWLQRRRSKNDWDVRHDINSRNILERQLAFSYSLVWKKSTQPGNGT